MERQMTQEEVAYYRGSGKDEKLACRVADGRAVLVVIIVVIIVAFDLGRKSARAIIRFKENRRGRKLEKAIQKKVKGD